MGLDIRIPLGLIFLSHRRHPDAVFGIATHGDSALYARSLGVNLNLLWGSDHGGLSGPSCSMSASGRSGTTIPVSPRPWERDSEAKPRH